MLKKVLILLLAITLIAVATACSSGDDGGEVDGGGSGEVMVDAVVDPAEPDDAQEADKADDVDEPSEPVVEQQAMNIIAVFDTSIISPDPSLNKELEVMVDEITVEQIAAQLTEWTGYRFTLNSVVIEDTIVTIDWSENSSLIANLTDEEIPDEFFVYDADTMRWFMMDSLYFSILENTDVAEVYYTMSGGETLAFEELQPVKELPFDAPYMGTKFYAQHSDVE